MARILCIDYGLKRTGIAVTDPMQIIATALTTIESKELIPFLTKYIQQEPVERILIGEPKNMDDSDTHGTLPAQQAAARIRKAFPAIPLELVDERYTSKMASRALIEMGAKKKDRQQKGNIDRIAATIMLQEYLQRNS